MKTKGIFWYGQTAEGTWELQTEWKCPKCKHINKSTAEYYWADEIPLEDSQEEYLICPNCKAQVLIKWQLP